MTLPGVRIATLVAVVLCLAACATSPAGERYGRWSYVQTPIDDADPAYWWTTLVGVPGAQSNAPGLGAGATVAIVGTGVLKGHEDLEVVLPGVATCGSQDTNDEDNGHGTQLAGIAVGRQNGKSTRGVAPKAALLPIKVDCAVVTADALTKGVDAAIALKPNVILMAFGGYPSGVPEFMLKRVTDNPEILFVIASAWDGTHYPYPPWTRVKNVLVVAAMTLDASAQDIRKIDPKKEIPYSTRRGDIWAPGRSVGTADIAPDPAANPHDQFLMHGTSPASAIVAGCAALVASKTGAKGAALRDALVDKADNNSDLGPAPNGRLNCAKAVP